MSHKKDVLKILFDDVSRTILYGLVDRKDPSQIATTPKDDTFRPTISAVFRLLEDLVTTYTPDLYQAEWLRICTAIEDVNTVSIHRLPSSLEGIRSTLVGSLEDVESLDGEINNFELSKKIAGFDPMTQCAIIYHVQKYIVAKRRNETYQFPRIQFKG